MALKRSLPTLVLLAVLLGVPLGASAQVVDVSGQLADASGKADKSSSMVQIVLQEYTSAEHTELLASELEQGVARFYRALTHIEKGYLRIGADVGYPIGYAQSSDGKILLLFDRQLPLFNVYRSLRSIDHPFGAIELTIDDKGNGEGRIIPAASVKAEGSGFAIDQEGTSTYPLVKVKATKK